MDSTWSRVLTGLLVLAPSGALAHERWFTDRVLHRAEWHLVLSLRTALALGAGLLAVAAFALLQRLLKDPLWPRLPFFARMAHGDMRLMSVQTAITLIYLAVRLAVLAPQLALSPSWLAYFCAAVEIAIAFTLITGVLDRLGAIALLLLWLGAGVLFSPVDMLHAAHFAGIALAVLLIGASEEAERPRAPFMGEKWGARGIAAVRVMTGISVLAVALVDKVWNPKLGEAFLSDHPNFNALRLVGLDVSDATFLLFAGVMETVIGLLLISGFLTRVVILAMLVPFNLTVPFLPAVEMMGHLPLFGIMYMLLVHGAGRHPAHLHEEQTRRPLVHP